MAYLTEMTPKYGIYLYFLCQQGGPGGAEWGDQDPPPTPWRKPCIVCVNLAKEIIYTVFIWINALGVNYNSPPPSD